MNLPINTSIAGLPGAIGSQSGGIAGINGQTQAHQNGSASLGDQDWFSAQSLSDGQTIEASRFDTASNGMSVDEAADKIYSQLFPGT